MNIYTLRKKLLKEKGWDDKPIYNWRDKHIGKRSAAGIWCWDCKVPMYDESVQVPLAGITIPKQLDACPNCGKKYVEKKSKFNPAMRELGFDKSKPKKRVGINGASSFTWCIDEYYGLGKTVKEIKEKLSKIKYVITEYDEKWTIKEFNAMFLEVIEQRYISGKFS